MILAMFVFHRPCPLCRVYWIVFLYHCPLCNAYLIVFFFSLPTVKNVSSHWHIITFHHNTMLHGPDLGMLMIQAPLVTYCYHAYWIFGLTQKYMPKSLETLLSLFEYLSFFLLCDSLHYSVVSMQTIACVYLVGHLPPYRITMLLQHKLCCSLSSKHDFFALMTSLLTKLFFLCQKYLWLPMSHYLVKAQHSKLRGCASVKSRLRFKYNHFSPASVNTIKCLL
jgi:hypothetical protein